MPLGSGPFETGVSPAITGIRMALEELENALITQPGWIKVHAAEYLIWLGYPRQVKKEFLSEQKLHNQELRYRLGIWRVLAQSEAMPEQKKDWIDKIYSAFADPEGEDRAHAAETLAKLKLSPITRHPKATHDALCSDDRILKTCTIWATAYTSVAAFDNSRQEMLGVAVSDADDNIRKICSFALRQLGGFTGAEWDFLAFKALSVPAGSELQKSLLNTAFVTSKQEPGKMGVIAQIKEEMLKDYKLFSGEKRVDLALSLAEQGDITDLPVLQSFLDNEHIGGIYEPESGMAAEVRLSAAFAILKIRPSPVIPELLLK